MLNVEIYHFSVNAAMPVWCWQNYESDTQCLLWFLDKKMRFSDFILRRNCDNQTKKQRKTLVINRKRKQLYKSLRTTFQKKNNQIFKIWTQKKEYFSQKNHDWQPDSLINELEISRHLKFFCIENRIMMQKHLGYVCEISLFHVTKNEKKFCSFD